ncbi:hypothetical protein B0H10DRAFT_2234221 [Mycena sp. CBHHK59/15]|nr:hypothetical protein B0H10DRAFT_2234221 [Mycena sp. CBHHK59/15]
MSENSTLEEFSYPLSLSSRSLTPGEPYHSAPLHYVAHSTASMLSQGSDDWITSSPASVVGPAAFAPNPFRYNHQKAPSVHLDCRQCITSKQERLVLETENATLKNAYNALLQVVGPAMFLAQTASPSDSVDLTVTPAGFSGLPSAPAIPALSQADYPAVNFLHAHEYRAHVDQSKGESNRYGPKPRGSSRAAQGINVAMRYVEDANGVVVNGFRATEIRGLATKLFALLAANGAAPASWNKGSLELQSKFSAEICRKFPEMGLCENDWKVQHMATRMYSSWYRTHTNSQVKLEAAEDDPVVLPASKPTKRPQPISMTANKRVKLSETPPSETNEMSMILAPTPNPVGHNNGDGSAPIPSKPTEEPTEPAVAFKIINPLLATPSAAATAAAAAAASLPTTDVEIANPPLSVTQATPASAVPSTMEVVPVVAPLPTTVPVTGTVLAGPSGPPRSAASKAKPKESKANPGTSTTPRNLCMIDWCKKHPRGYLSQFKAYWDSIENTSDAEPYKQVSANAATSKTKLTSTTQANALGVLGRQGKAWIF